MTIHDILCNCGSVNSKTYVAVVTLGSSNIRNIVWGGLFRDLPKKVEYKCFSYYMIGWYFCEDTNSNQAYFRFYV